MTRWDVINFATERHAGQTYGDGAPYTEHLAAVELVLASFGYHSPFWVACAWLHDVLEDTATTRQEIVTKFGCEVANTVYAVSGFGANRRERNSCIYAKIVLDRRATILKLADRIANVEACAAVNHRLGPMYLRERGEFYRAVGIHGPRNMLARLLTAYDAVHAAARAAANAEEQP